MIYTLYTHILNSHIDLPMIPGFHMAVLPFLSSAGCCEDAGYSCYEKNQCSGSRLCVDREIRLVCR